MVTAAKIVPFPLSPLTARELEILRLIKTGYSNQEIGQQLFLSPETVKWYNKQIFSKLDVSSRTAAVAHAERMGLLRPEPAVTAPAPADLHAQLPVSLTRFIGRNADQSALIQLLQHKRLVTLTGPGGTGKTRLALEVAHQLGPQFRDGVCFVDLAPVTAAEQVPDAVLRALSLSPAPDQLTTKQLARYFRPRHMLLVADNFEHVLDAAKLVTDWLEAAPWLHVLATSRERLRLRGEIEYPVAPLTLPPVGAPDEALGASEAIALFLDRAREVRAGFGEVPADAQIAAAICRRLDGLPLSIELAAARLKLFSAPNLLAQLDQRFAVLTEGPRDLPVRHQTLYSAVAWSYDLLTPDEKVLFLCCSVFLGGWTLEAAQYVARRCIGPDYDDITGLSALVDKSLIRVADTVSGEPRFTMLETLRAFAQEQLSANPELAEIANAEHAACYLELAGNAWQTMYLRDEIVWFARLESDHDNLRASLNWVHQREDGAEAELRLTGALGLFWYNRGYYAEGRAHAEQALQRDSSAIPPHVRADAFHTAGYLANAQGDHERARNVHMKGLAIYRELDNTRMIVHSLNCLSAQYMEPAGVPLALAFCEEGWELARRTGDEEMEAEIATNYACALLSCGRESEADAIFEQGSRLARKHGMIWHLTFQTINMGERALERNDPFAAEALFLESLALGRQIGEQYCTSAALCGLAQISMGRGDTECALAQAQEAAVISRRIGRTDVSEMAERLVAELTAGV